MRNRKHQTLDQKAKTLQTLFRRFQHLKKNLEKNGYEVMAYLSENILIVRKRII